MALIQTRKGGVVVSERQLPYYMEWPQKRLAAIAVAGLEPAEEGIFWRLKMMCAITRNAGSITIGEKTRCRRDDIIEYIVAQLRSSKQPRRAARAIYQKIKAGGLITEDRRGVVYVVNFTDEQMSDSPEAVRKREWRALQREQRERRQLDDEGNEPGKSSPRSIKEGMSYPSSGKSSPSPSSPPASISTRTPDGSPPTRDRDEADPDPPDASRTRPGIDKIETETEIEKRDKYLSNSNSISTSAGGEEGEGDLYAASDPVLWVMEHTGDHSQLMRNICREGMRQLGRSLFLTCMAELRDAIRDGTIRDRSEARYRKYFCGVLKDKGYKSGGNRIADRRVS